MRVELRLPELGLQGTPVTLCAWHVKRGETVLSGEQLVEISAGPAAIDLPSPASGVLMERAAREDDALAVGQLIAVIETEG